MQLYFLRHGQSANNALWSATGSDSGRSEDPELTPLGRRQARRLAHHLARGEPVRLAGAEGHALSATGFGITHLYSSLMLRAVETGTILAAKLGLPLVAWEDIHEGGGIYLDDAATGQSIGRPGKNRAWFEAHFPQLILPDTLGEAGWWSRPFEPREDRPLRAARFLDQLRARHGDTDDRVAIVSHGGFFNHLMTALLRLPRREGIWFHMNNAAMTRFDFQSQEVGVTYMNRIDYLLKEYIT